MYAKVRVRGVAISRHIMRGCDCAALTELVKLYAEVVVAGAKGPAATALVQPTQRLAVLQALANSAEASTLLGSAALLELSNTVVIPALFTALEKEADNDNILIIG